jgi:hypothetical protein
MVRSGRVTPLTCDAGTLLPFTPPRVISTPHQWADDGWRRPTGLAAGRSFILYRIVPLPRSGTRPQRALTFGYEGDALREPSLLRCCTANHISCHGVALERAGVRRRIEVIG